MLPLFTISLLFLTGIARAHIAPWHKGMYCLNGTRGVDNSNTNEATNPATNLPRRDWWMHHFDKCDEFPPSYGDFLDLPAGGTFTVEMASNRGQTTLSYGGRYTSEWGDGHQHPEDYNVPTCITSPNLHAQNETMAAGSVFAISYQSDITKVTPENLVVFTVRKNTPFRRLATFDVPAMLPACPSGGCHCVWGWVPNHCGTANMYMLPYRCKVSNPVGIQPLARARPPVWCKDNPFKCVKGPKQMIFWSQLEGNNVVLSGYQKDGREKSPGYNHKMGFFDGAQDDIFDELGPPLRRFERPMILVPAS